MDLNIARIDHARDAFPSERTLQRAFHWCGCITIRDMRGNVLCGVACLFVPEHRADIKESDNA